MYIMGIKRNSILSVATFIALCVSQVLSQAAMQKDSTGLPQSSEKNLLEPVPKSPVAENTLTSAKTMAAGPSDPCPPNLEKEEAPDRMTSLQRAAAQGDAERVMQLVVGCGADVNRLSLARGSNALHEAVFHGRADAAAVLIQLGADPNMPKADGWAPVHLAAVGKDPKSTFELLARRGADLKARTKNSEALSVDGILDRYRKKEPGVKDYFRTLSGKDCPEDVNRIVEHGFTRLQRAVHAGDLGRAKQLVKTCGADVNARSAIGSNALHEAAYNGESELVSFLIEAGTDPNSLKDDGWAAVHLAVIGRDPLPVLAALASHGADLSLKTAPKTAAEIAGTLGKANSDVVAFLRGNYLSLRTPEGEVGQAIPASPKPTSIATTMPMNDSTARARPSSESTTAKIRIAAEKAATADVIPKPFNMSNLTIGEPADGVSLR